MAAALCWKISPHFRRNFSYNSLKISKFLSKNSSFSHRRAAAAYSTQQQIIFSKNYEISTFSSRKTKPFLVSISYLSTSNVLNNSATTENLLGSQNKIVETPLSKETLVSSETSEGSRLDTAVAEPDVTTSSSSVEFIPEPPPIPSEISELLNVQPTLQELGLGSYHTPVGLLENFLHYINESLGVPWWSTIVICTLVVRICVFPLVIKAQQNAMNMNNHMPQMQVLQAKMAEARQRGNQIDAARYAGELMDFMKEKKLNPFKSVLIPLAQAPIFISFFLSLRAFANLPLESMKTGGIFWFTDLTIADPFYLLPLITSTTLFATFELAAEGGIRPDNLPLMKYFLRALPIIIFPFTMNFPTAILCYWCTSNFVSLAQVGFLRIPAVRDYFKIPPKLTLKKENMPVKKGFVTQMKDSMTNSRIVREIEERQRLDDVNFKKAGLGAVPKTYPYDPTKQHRGK